MSLEPNPEQQAAIKWRGGHALVLAGAGTGKTFTIIERTRSLIRDGVSPQRLALLTFTRRAAGEMSSRIGADTQGLFAGTFHSWAIHWMRRARGRFPIDPAEWTIIDRDDQLQALRRIKSRHVPRGEAKLYPTPANVLNYVGYARSKLVHLEEYLDRFTDMEPTSRKFVLTVDLEYRQWKRSRRYMDYDDILEVLAEAMVKDKNLARDIGIQYVEVLVDETQDVNPLQWVILDAIRPHARLFLVGDDAQSIYAFRGADFQSIHSFKQRVPDGTVLKLNRNYRSTQNVLDLSNWLLRQSPLGYDKDLKGVRGKGEKPRLVQFPDEYQEAEWICQQIIEAHRQGAPLRDHKILLRTARMGRNVEAALIEHKIPYQFVGGQQFFALSHTKDLLSTLRATINFRDELAWGRFLTLFPRIGDGTAEKVTSGLLEASSIRDAKQHIRTILKDRTEEVLRPIVEVSKHREAPAKALNAALDALRPVLEHNYRDDWKKRKPDLDLMVQLGQHRKDIQDFVETYTLDPITGSAAQRSEGEDAVLLITIHSAKGLEGKTVFIPQAQEGNYPHSRALGNRDEVEEERRVLYVALTRAQDRLVLTDGGADFYYSPYFGDDAQGFFLDDAPKSVLKREGKGRKAQHSTRIPLDKLTEWEH